LPAVPGIRRHRTTWPDRSRSPSPHPARLRFPRRAKNKNKQKWVSLNLPLSCKLEKEQSALSPFSILQILVARRGLRLSGSMVPFGRLAENQSKFDATSRPSETENIRTNLRWRSVFSRFGQVALFPKRGQGALPPFQFVKRGKFRLTRFRSPFSPIRFSALPKRPSRISISAADSRRDQLSYSKARGGGAGGADGRFLPSASG